MFGKPVNEKENFLERTKAAREERALEKKREQCAIKIQASVRRWLCRIRFTRTIHEGFDALFSSEIDTDEECAILTTDLRPALEVYHTARRLFLIFQFERDKLRIERLCRYIVASLQSESLKLSYVGVFFLKEHSISWLSHMKELLYKCCQYLEVLKPESPTDMQTILLHLHTLVAFTATNTWAITKLKNLEKLRSGMTQLCANIMGALFHRGYYLVLKSLLLGGLCRERVALKNVSLTAIVTLSMRPLISSQFSEKLLTMYIIQILSVPGLVHHMEQIAPECLAVYKSHLMFEKSIEFLSTDQNLRIVFNTLEGNYALCLLANLVHLASMDEKTSTEIYFPSFVIVVTRFLESCQQLVVGKQSNLSSWHPVLGWVSGGGTSSGGASKARGQLSKLWGGALLRRLLAEPLANVLNSPPTPSPPGQLPPPASTSASSAANFIRRAIEARTNRANAAKNFRKLGSPECTNVALICSMYQTALTTLTQLKLDILTGLCNQDMILYYLWKFICSLGPNCGLKSFLDLLAINTKTTAPEFQILILFADCMTHYVTILDDMEMYEQQSPFKLSDFITMSNFLNLFLYKGVLANLFETKSVSGTGLFGSMHALLQVLYRRDCRRSYTPPGHWLAKDLRIGPFMADLDKGKKAPQLLMTKMPHIIPHSERVQLFRRSVANEKAVLGLTEQACAPAPRPTLITVHRRRVLEDGYRQLAALPPHALKAVVRVRFVNEQGLDEAGIDQDGVFKEFLEETIKLVFDPTLDLFRATSEARLYPSPTAALHDSHLQLFEFVGRMLGKAVYEGIVVDVPFASFFLSQVLGQTHQALYSWIDELPSLDKELYRSLTFIKHHQEDISTLELTFSVDEDRLGDIVTHELIPGGKAIPLTNENNLPVLVLFSVPSKHTAREAAAHVRHRTNDLSVTTCLLSKINYIHLMAHFRMHTQIKEQTNAFIKGFRSIINPEWLSLFSTPEVQRLISGDTAPLDLRDLRRHTQYYGGFHDSHQVVAWLWDVLNKDFTEEERAMFLKFVTSCSKPPLLGFAHLEPPFSIRCVEVGDDEDTGDTIGSVIRGFFTIRKKDPLNRLPTSSTCFNLLKLPNYQKRSTLRDKLRYAVNSNTGFELS